MKIIRKLNEWFFARQEWSKQNRQPNFYDAWLAIAKCGLLFVGFFVGVFVLIMIALSL